MNIQRICKALYKYEAVEEGELSFEEDSLLYIVDDSDEAWWKASTELNSTDEMNIGLIPYNYVEEIDYIAKYRAIYDYEAQGEDELSFEEGVEILVYQVEGEDWMLGCINGSFGFVPQNYTEEIIEDTNEQNNYAEEGYMEEYEDAVQEVEQELPQVSKNINESIDQHNTTPLSTKKIAKDDMLFWRVSEVDKSKKKKQKVRLGISSNMIFVASEEEKGSPVKQWAISDLVSYSLKNKHIIIELSGKDSITFDFSCSSIKQAEAIAFKIKSCSDAIYREKAEDKNSKGFFGMFKKSTKSSAAPPKSYQQHSPQYNQSDDVPTIKDKYETVPLPPIPQEEIDRASEQQKQFYPETRTQLRVPSNNSISSTPSKAGNESKKGKPAIVVYDFDAAEEGELSVVADTRIYILDSDTDSDWWRCRIYRSDEDYDEGFVPAEYVTLLPSDAPQSSALAGGNNVANEPSSIMVREWTDTTGSFKVEAEFIKFSENKIHLHKVNGVKIAVPIEKMSMVDLKYVSELIGEDLTESLDSTRKQNAESEKWLRFFKDCNVADDEAQVYATTFTKEKIDRSLLKSMDKSSLKDLGLVEGDSIRVLNAIKSDNISKAPKGKRSVTFNPNTTVIDPSKDEELAYKLQQEEIERVRKEKASGSFVELQIEQDEMLARRLQGQGDSNSSWEGFSDLGTSSSESKKYGLGLSGGLGSKPKGKSSSIDQQKIAKATEFLEAENQKENKDKVKDDDKSKSKPKSKSGFDDDIWGVPGQRATYQKKTPPTVAKDITPASPTVVSPTVASPTTTKATITSDPWAVFPDSNTKASSTASETPIFSSDNSVRRDTKGKSNSALDQDWSSLSAEFSKISVNDSATVKPIKVAPEVTKKGNQDFAVFTKVQQASPRRPSTPQLTQPQIQQSSSMFVQQQQMPTQQIQNNVPVILAQPLIPIPSGNLSNVFIPTRRPAPPKPTQNQNVFGDANATFSSNSSVSSLPVNNQSSKASDNMQVGASIFNQSAQNKESGSVFSTISTPNTQSNSNIFGSNSNTQPSVNVFGSSTTPSATLSNKSNGNVTTSNQEQALDLFGTNSKALSPMSDIKREGSMSSLASFNIPHNNSDSSSTPLNSSMLLNKNLDTFDSKNFNYKNDFAMDSPIISERSFSGNLHDTSMSTINLPSNMDYSISTTTTNRTKASSSNYQFDDLSLKSLGVTSTPKIPQYSSGNKNQNTQTQGSVNYNLGISQNSSTGLGSTFDSVPRLMDSTPVKLNEFDQFRMELDKPSSLNQSFDINTGSNTLNESPSYNTMNAHSSLNKETNYGTASSHSYTGSNSNLNTININQSASSSFSSTIQGNSYNLLSNHTTPTANLTRSLTPTLSNTNNNNMGYSIGGYNTLDSTKAGLHTSSSLNDIPGLYNNNTNNLNMNSSLLNNSFNTSGNLSHNQTGLNNMTGQQSNFNSSRNEFNTSLSSSKLLGINQSAINNSSGLKSMDYNSPSTLSNNTLGMSGNNNVLGMSSNSGLGMGNISTPNNFSSLSMSSNLQQDKVISSHSNLGLASGNMNDYSYAGNTGSSFGQNNGMSGIGSNNGMNGLGNNSGMSGLGSTYGNNNINNSSMNIGSSLNNYSNTAQYTSLSTNSMSSMNINSNLNNAYSGSSSSYGNHLNTSLNSSSLNNSNYNQNTLSGGGLNNYNSMDLNRPIGNNSSLGYNSGLQGNMMNQQLNQGMNNYQQQGQGMNNYQQQSQNMGGYQQQFNPMNNNNFNSNNYGQGNNYRM